MSAVKQKATLILLALPAILLLVFFFLVPLGEMLARSVTGRDGGLSLQHYSTLLQTPTYLVVTARTLWMSAACTLATALLGLPVAYFLSVAPPSRLKTMILATMLLSFLTSSLVRAFAWMIVLGAQGPVALVGQQLGFVDGGFLGTLPAVFVGMVHFLLPLFVLIAYSGMNKIRHELMTAAEGMGARHAYAIWTIYLPLAAPAIVRSSLIVFITSIGFYITPALLGGPRQIMLAQLISQRIDLFGDFGLASAIGFGLLVLTLICLGASNLLIRLLGRNGNVQ